MFRAEKHLSQCSLYLSWLLFLAINLVEPLIIAEGGRGITRNDWISSGATLATKHWGNFSSFPLVKVIPMCRWHTLNLCIRTWRPRFWGGQSQACLSFLLSYLFLYKITSWQHLLVLTPKWGTSVPIIQESLVGPWMGLKRGAWTPETGLHFSS